jgi:hypothetical protein
MEGIFHYLQQRIGVDLPEMKNERRMVGITLYETDETKC